MVGALSSADSRVWTCCGALAGLVSETVVSVLVAEVLIFIPSIANFRLRWLEERLNTAAVATLVLVGTDAVDLPRSVQDDVAHVAAIKKALGDRAAVRVDVNMAWSELQAQHGLAALADAGCELDEQPVATTEALARLGQALQAKVAQDWVLTGGNLLSWQRAWTDA